MRQSKRKTVRTKINKKEHKYSCLMRKAFELAISDRKRSMELNSEATELLEEIQELRAQVA